MDQNWIKSIIDDIKFISDNESQQHAWTKNKIKQEDWFETLIDRLYDGGDLEHLIEYCSEHSLISKKQLSLLKELCKKLNDYSYKTEIYSTNVPYLKVDEKKILADPKWHEMQKLAKDVLIGFKDFPLLGKL